MDLTIPLDDADKINNKIQIILRQTDYTEETAIEKLKENNFDELETIKDYLGITKKKSPVIKSLNQEIYKQLRNKLDLDMRDYKKRVERGETKLTI